MGRKYYHGTDHNKKAMKYLFSGWARVEKTLRDKFLYLFLDYDGTLAPIAQMPGKAIIPKKTKDILRQLSKMPDCKIAIVSGRALKDISKRVGLKNIVYVGNHGFEIKGPKIKFKSPLPYTYRKTLEKIKDKLEENLSSVRGIFIEDKGFSLSVHYRMADEKGISRIKTEFYAALVAYKVREDIRIRTGKKVLEIRPPIAWDKGKVVLWLLAQHKFAMRSKKRKVFPVYIGDDETDEDAFESLKDKGMTILVGKSNKTKARFYLKDTGEVMRFLKAVLKNPRAGILWRKKK